MAHDPINPAHYRQHPSGVECITIVEHMPFNVGNAMKYLWRAGLKSPNAIEDLRKAAWYVQREIERLTEASKPDPAATAPAEDPGLLNLAELVLARAREIQGGGVPKNCMTCRHRQTPEGGLLTSSNCGVTGQPCWHEASAHGECTPDRKLWEPKP